MRVAVVGGFRPDPENRWPPLWGKEPEFEQACKDIGRTIARHGHTLLVQYDDALNADPHIVDGYVTQAQAVPRQGMHSIVVSRPQNAAKRPFDDTSRHAPSLFEFKTMPTRKWDSARFLALADADLTILIGGGARTEMTAYIGRAAGRPLIPIGSFGGAAEQVLNDLPRALPADFGWPSSLTPGLLSQRWSSSLSDALDATLANPSPVLTVIIVHGRDLVARNSLVTLLGALPGEHSARVMGLEQVFGATLPEKWESIARGADAAIVIATPDDEGRLAGETTYSRRARQNVVLELGWFWGRFMSRDRLLVLEKRDDSFVLELPSDISGIETHAWKNDPNECAHLISRFMESLRSKPRPR